MRTFTPRSAYAIRLAGWQALTERLGPSGAMRFMMKYDSGHGDHSQERRALFAGVSLDELLKSSGTAATGPEAPRAGDAK